MSSQNLRQAIDLIRIGEKQEGRSILLKVLRTDPQNELAWMWMSRTVDTKKQQSLCLQKALAINPDNQAAQKALDKLSYQTDPPTKNKPKDQTRTAPKKSAPPITKQELGRFLLIGGGVSIILILIAAAGVFMMQQRKSYQEFAPLADICRGQRVSGTARYLHNSAKHPAIGFSIGSEGWEIDNSFIPSKAQSQSPGETQLVLCMGKVEDIFIETCPYVSKDNPQGPISGRIDRYYYKQKAKLVEPGTGRVVSLREFTGNSARMCKEVERFPSDGRTIVLKGSSIPKDQIRHWIESELL